MLVIVAATVAGRVIGCIYNGGPGLNDRMDYRLDYGVGFHGPHGYEQGGWVSGYGAGPPRRR